MKQILLILEPISITMRVCVLIRHNSTYANFISLTFADEKKAFTDAILLFQRQTSKKGNETEFLSR